MAERARPLCWRAERMQSNLGVLPVDPIHDSLIGRIAKSALDPRDLVVVVTLSEAFRAIIIGITKRLVDTLDSVSAGHEYLRSQSANFDQ